MNKFWNFFNGYKTIAGTTLSAIGSASAIAIACGVTGGIPLVVAGVCAAGGSLLTIVGRIHTGTKLADQQAQIIDLVNQVKVIKQYAQK